MWHCPHCGAPQAETARCWVCHRSSTTCSTCRDFRTSLAADLGYCGLDRRRQPLTGRELRGCWTERPADAAPTRTVYDETLARASDVRRARSSDRAGARQVVSVPARGFVPVDDVGALPATPAPTLEAAPSPADPAAAFLRGDAIEGWDTRTSLFGDAEG